MDYRKILIVDDEPDICELLSEEFADYGFEVAIAYDGQEALDCLQQFDAFLVFTDINMPVMNGIELLDTIQKMEENRPYVIMCTGFKGYERELLVKKGAIDLLSKPFDYGRLEAIVRSLTGDD